MRVEVINTGDELLLGRCVNTHQAFFGRRVFEVGLRIDRQVAVLDGEPIRGAMAEAFGRCDVLIMTGGLGPTSDDLTRDVAADLLGLEMSEDAGVIEVIEARLGARGKTVTADSRRQALVPRGAEVLANPNGTAPGLYLAAGEGTPHLFLLPGPPRELLPMFDAEVMPRLRAITVGGEMPGIREFKFFGVGESEVAAAVEPGVKSIDGIVHGYQVEAAHVNFRCIGTDEGLDAASALVGDVLGGFLVSDDGRSLEKVVVDLLVERGETACTAESCTGGGDREFDHRCGGGVGGFSPGLCDVCERGEGGAAGGRYGADRARGGGERGGGGGDGFRGVGAVGRRPRGGGDGGCGTGWWE